MDETDIEYISEVLAIYYSRNKILRYTELLDILHNKNCFPTLIEETYHNLDVIDPMVAYTKTAKSYNTSNNSISGYSNPHRFTPRLSVSGLNFGNSSQSRYELLPIAEKPLFKGDTHNYLDLILSLPFVYNVYIVGSHALHIQQENSDIDIMVEVAESKALFMRYCIKIILKLIKLDVHNIFWNLGQNEANTKKLLHKQQKLKSTGIKIDIGIVTSNISAFEELYLVNIPKQIWLKRKKRITRETDLINITLNEPQYIIYPTLGWFDYILRSIAHSIVWILLPMNGLITKLEKLRLSKKLGMSVNYIANEKMVSFIPKIHSHTYYYNPNIQHDYHESDNNIIHII